MRQLFMATALLSVLLSGQLNPIQAMVLTGGIQEWVVTPIEKGIVGMDIQVPHSGYPLIKQVFAGAPAHLAGIRPGDSIIKIDGQLTYGKTAKAIDVAISDIPGTPVSFTIKRESGSYTNLMLVVAPLSRTASQIQG